MNPIILLTETLPNPITEYGFPTFVILLLSSIGLKIATSMSSAVKSLAVEQRRFNETYIQENRRLTEAVNHATRLIGMLLIRSMSGNSQAKDEVESTMKSVNHNIQKDKNEHPNR